MILVPGLIFVPKMAVPVDVYSDNIKMVNLRSYVYRLGCWFSWMYLFSASSSSLVLGLYVLLHNFYCKFSCYLPQKNSDLRYIYIYIYI
jgi:hypothetical protein